MNPASGGRVEPIDLDTLTRREIERRRPVRRRLDPWKPNGFFVESEFARSGRLEDVATILLTNRECPFRCLMCDLWKNTLTTPTPVGAIPRQIAYALARLGPARHVKLYNSGNFFDAAAIPPVDHGAIASLVSHFDTVIVENHPNLCGSACIDFRRRLGSARLEVAMGLETIHPVALPRLQKRMTTDDFRRAAHALRQAGIHVRAFVLLRPPGLEELEGVEWALRSLEFALECGADVASVIGTRAGNGILDRLRETGQFVPPRLDSLERVLEIALGWRRGRIFADLWQIEQLAACSLCRAARVRRMKQMNRTQLVPPSIDCVCQT